MREATANTRQLSPVALGGVTFLLVVAFALSASASLKGQANVRSETAARTVLAVESLRVVRQPRAQRQVPAAPVRSRATRFTVASITPAISTAPVVTLPFVTPLHQADLPPPVLG